MMDATYSLEKWAAVRAIPPGIAAFFLSLGNFVYEFAQAEKILQLYLRQLSGLPASEAQASYGMMQITSILKCVRKERQTRGLNSDILEDALVQFEKIKTARDVVLHNGAMFGSEGFTTSRILRECVPGREVVIPVAPGDLDAMAEDIRKICNIVVVETTQLHPDAGFPAEFRLLLRQTAAAPWKSFFPRG
jgi:hypothetical protein